MRKRDGKCFETADVTFTEFQPELNLFQFSGCGIVWEFHFSEDHLLFLNANNLHFLTVKAFFMVDIVFSLWSAKALTRGS